MAITSVGDMFGDRTKVIQNVRTASGRCRRLNGCPESQKVRGVATGNERPPRDRLVAVRDAWGDFDAPPVVALALAPPDWLVDPVEDF